MLEVFTVHINQSNTGLDVCLSGEEDAVPDVRQLPIPPAGQHEGEAAEEEGGVFSFISYCFQSHFYLRSNCAESTSLSTASLSQG